MGNSALIPAPMSQNAPNGSMCVTQASITSPQTSDERYSLRQSSCTLRRLRMACFALLIHVEPGYAENNRLVHPRDQRDIAHASVLDSERTLVFRYYAAHAAEVNMEIVLAVAQHGSALERSPAFASLPEQCRRAEDPGVLRRRQQCSLGFEAGHCLFSPFAAPRFDGEPIVLKICGILRPQCTKCENNVIIIYSPIKEEERWMSEWATSSS